MATSSPVVAASAAKAATPAEAAAKLGATYPHEQMATRPLDLNPAHWYAAIKWHYDGGTLNWPMIIYIGLCHYWAVLGLTRLATVHTYTLLWAYVLWPITGLGITAGVHRLWSHRSYTAGPALRCLLMLMNSIANQGSIFHWARDHRVHHKHSETTADPHNAQRGFFYAHVGWLLCKKHPDVVKEGKKLDFNDLKRDGFVMFQRKLDPWFTMFMCFVFPGLVAKFGWGERFWDAVWVRLPALHLRAALDVARQQRGAHLRRPPLQRAVARREPDRLVLRGRRGLAQLAPPVPLRLRRVGIRHHVAVQPHEALHRLLLLARHGLEPEASDVLVGAHEDEARQGRLREVELRPVHGGLRRARRGPGRGLPREETGLVRRFPIV